MKKTLLIAIFALLPFAATNASAQNKAMVNVRFAFIANHQVIPAGHYQILSSDSILMLIDANTGRTQAALLVRHETADAIESHGDLRFQVDGNRHVLIEAQFAGSSMHCALLAKPKLERSLARGSKPAINTIEVAMR